MKKLKIGIIGYGFMGQWHANHAGTMDNIQIVAICDIDPAKLAIANSEVQCYIDYHKLLNNPEVETVMVSVPNHLHRQVAVDAANAGKNIIVEKPVAMNVAEFDEIEDAAHRAGVLFTVDQNRRWDKDYLIAKKVIETKLLGNVFTIESRLYGIFGLMHDWHVKKKFGGGMMYDWGVHLFDQLLNLIPGKVTEVFADVRIIKNKEVDDYYKVILNFENGMTASVELGTYMLKNFPRWYIGGDNGTMVVNNFLGDGKVYRAANLPESLPQAPTNTNSGPTRTFSTSPDNIVSTEPLPKVTGEWGDFFLNYLDVINGKAELIVKPSETRRVLALMEAVRKSSDLRKSVSFE